MRKLTLLAARPPRKEPHRSNRLLVARKQTGEDAKGEAWYRIAPNLLSGPANTRFTHRFSDCRRYRHLRRVCQKGTRDFVKSRRPEYDYRSVLARRNIWANRVGQPHASRKKNLILVTAYSNRSSKPTGIRKERHGTESPQISFLAQRTRSLGIASSKVADIDIYDEFANKELATSYNSFCPKCDYTSVRVTSSLWANRVGWPHFRRAKNLILVTSYSQRGMTPTGTCKESVGTNRLKSLWVL